MEATDPQLHALTITWFDHAREVAAGELPDGPFRGVPFLLKDLYASYAGQTLSNGNRALKDAGDRRRRRTPRSSPGTGRPGW